MGLCLNGACTILGCQHAVVLETGELTSPALGLPPGTSDPYCRVALVHEGQVNKPHRDLAHWQEKSVVNTVMVTPVVQKNLNPEWNKSFHL